MRVMAFEGDPLSGDLSFLDTVDPLLPSRAYLVAGDEERPIAMAVAVTSEGQQDPAADLGTIYASRGTEFSLPAADERTAAIQQAAWENDRGDTFYTLNVRALPEVTFTSQKLGGQLRQAAQFLDVVTVQVDIGQGSEDGEVDFLSRPVCTGEIGSAGAEILAGPSSQYRSLGRLAPGQDVELLGENGDYYLIVSPTSPTGGAWVLKSALMGVDTGGLACSRFQPFPPPILDGSNSANPGGGGNDPLVGLPPLGGDGPNDNPGPGDSSIVIPPPDSPPPSNPPPAPPGQTSSFLAAYVECIDLGDGDYDVTVSYSGASGTEFTLNIGGVPFVTSGPVPDGAVSFYVSGISLGGSVSGGTLSDGLTTVPVGGSAECFFSWGD
jgi:hypothetical protein